MNDCVKLLNLDKPNYLKIDVDGIEDLILKNSYDTLERAESILVEVDNSFENQAKNIQKYLSDAGFRVKEKQYLQIRGKNLQNQIWEK